MVQLGNGVINCAGSVIEGILWSNISHNKTTVRHLKHFQHTRVEGQVQLECREIGNAINFNGYITVIIDLRYERRGINPDSSSALCKNQCA